MTTSLDQQFYRIFDYPIDASALGLKKSEEDLEKQKKLEGLRKDIGNELFNSLSEEDKLFILETEGMIDLGHKFTKKDFKKVEKSLREDYEY